MTAGAEIRVSVSPGEVRVAGYRHGQLEAAAIERPSQPHGVGDLHKARVTAVMPAMSGAFLLLGDGRDGFLPESELPAPRRPIGKALHEGQFLPVRVMRAAQGGKGPRLTGRLTPDELRIAEGNHQRAPSLLRPGPCAALRLAHLWPEAKVITDGSALAASLRLKLADGRVTLRLSGAFDEEIETAFQDLAEPRVALPGGGSLLIHPTPALTAIDVDSGSLAGSRHASGHEVVNDVAITAIARAIRLRNLAGAILVDFAGLSVKRRESLIPALAMALRPDSLAPNLLGMTRLGLMEIVRTRIYPPLHEIFGIPLSPLTLGLGMARQALREASAWPGAKLILVASPEVVQALESAPEALESYQHTSGRSLILKSDHCLRMGQEYIKRSET